MDKSQSLIPLSFSDDQLDQIFRAAAPLTPAERVAFLEDLASVLREAPCQGDGSLYRVIREVQRRHWDPPLVAAGAGAPSQSWAAD
jgi:hypothetical protein